MDAEAIFGLAIHGSIRKRRPSMAAAPSGFPGTCSYWWNKKVKDLRQQFTDRAWSQWLDQAFDVPDPAHATCIRTPGGRPAWMPAVFGADRDVRCENGNDTAHPLSGFDLTRKVLSFGYFSLHQQRKVTRRQAKALLL
ncbi:hypothetical protein [Lysobacter sp. M15]|uniref:hypothetical protein n=1 Tax=Lysobacter sp. M15 TaxID=2916837 RepID=UPI001F585A80|nr:hypothetical protein [Lysobacter sp. M15]